MIFNKLIDVYGFLVEMSSLELLFFILNKCVCNVSHIAS